MEGYFSDADSSYNHTQDLMMEWMTLFGLKCDQTVKYVTKQLGQEKTVRLVQIESSPKITDGMLMVLVATRAVKV